MNAKSNQIMQKFLKFLLLLLHLLHSSSAAPAQHHLTIGVEGDTPLLIVTSAEIGLTPELWQKTTVTKTATATPTPTTTTPTINTAAASIKTVDNAKIGTKPFVTMPTIVMPKPTPIPTTKITTTTKEMPQNILKTEQQQQQKILLLQDQQHQTQQLTRFPLVSNVNNAEMKPIQETATFVSIHDDDDDVVDDDDDVVVDDDNVAFNSSKIIVADMNNQLVTAATISASESDATTTTTTRTPTPTTTKTLMIAQDNEVPTTSITRENDKENMEAATAANRLWQHLEMETPVTTISSSFAVEAVENNIENDKVLTTYKPQHNKTAAATTTTTTTKAAVAATKQKQFETTAAAAEVAITTTATTTTSIPTVTMRSNMPETIVKLIDVEQNQMGLKKFNNDNSNNNNNNKDIINSNNKHAAFNKTELLINNIASTTNGGHDGIKQTRKKQLYDEHKMAAAATTTSLTETELERITEILETSTTAKTPAATLLPVHNGYLGPIFMGEKTFSVVHPLKKPHAHEASIEDQIRQGRLIEIIAPTALLEDSFISTTTTTTRTTTTTTATAATNSNAETKLHEEQLPAAAMLSTTVFQVPETEKLQTSTTRQPQKNQQQQQQQQQNNKENNKNRNIQTESKISDIQIEVYDSTVDSIVASTNFKDAANDAYYAAAPLDGDADGDADGDVSGTGTGTFGTTRPPLSLVTQQERFTQYVIDRADVSTQESSVSPLLAAAAGKPEPAAIEIHINVSEGIGSESEDLEFSYRQTDNNNNNNNSNNRLKSIQSLNYATNGNSREHNSDEILVVEIIDTGDNITENSASSEHINPIFTFRSDNADTELKDVKYVPPDAAIVRPPQLSDELFMADVKDGFAAVPPPPPPPPPRKPSTIDRDSDTIFYISNTEVKVGESLPTAASVTNIVEQQRLQLQQLQEQQRKTNLENQFFPVNYSPHTPHSQQQQQQQSQPQSHHYEEDIILSPLRNTADSLKIFRSQPSNNAAADGAPPLDVTYVGESVIEVEQLGSSGSGSGGGIGSTIAPAQMPDVVIQPAILPELSIGVPVIGELPPQIELKEIDFMPGETSAASLSHGGIYENELDDRLDGNSLGAVAAAGGGVYYSNTADADAIDNNRLIETSIQYGGDLIDDGAGGGFDGVEGSYPFDMPHHKAVHTSYAHFAPQKHVYSHLRKDELNVDVSGGGGGGVGGVGAAASSSSSSNIEGSTADTLHENGTQLLPRYIGNESALVWNNNATQPEQRMGSNATAYSEEPSNLSLEENGYLNVFAISVGLVIIILPVLLFVAMFCGVRYILQKNRNNLNDEQQSDGCDANADVEKDALEGHHQFEYTNCRSTSNELAAQFETDQQKQPIVSLDRLTAKKTSIITTTTTKAAATEVVAPTTTTPTTTITNLNDTINVVAVADAANFIQNAANLPYCSHSSQMSQNESSVQMCDNFYPNGSVTKMTLRDNHLIVVTEERNDISRNARETKMHTDKDGVFVVEVARGIDSKHMPESPSVETTDLPFETKSQSTVPISLLNGRDGLAALCELNGVSGGGTGDQTMPPSHEQVQIHAPPTEVEERQRSLHLIEEVEEEQTQQKAANTNEAIDDTEITRPLAFCSNTGLSQSDLSSTSSTDSNKRYSYGNQELYIIEQPGYATISPTSHVILSTAHADADATQDNNDNDRKSENGNSLLAHTTANVKPTTAEDDDDDVNDEKLQQQQHQQQQQQQMTQFTNGAEKHENDVQPEQQKQQQQEQQQHEPQLQLNEANNSDIIENGHVPEKVVEKEEDQTEAEEISVPKVFAHLNGTTEKIHFVNEENTNNDIEPTYDSIMSLPDPPSNEEIKQLSDFTLIESNQLDSLPPPPPPVAIVTAATTPTTTTETELPVSLTASTDSNGNNGSNATHRHYNDVDMVAAVKRNTLTNGNLPMSATPPSQFPAPSTSPAPSPSPPPPPTTTTVTATTEKNDTTVTLYASTIPPDIDISNGKVLSSTLTPPASPPASPASAAATSPSPPPPPTTLYGKGGAMTNGVVVVGGVGGICPTLSAVAVDVNGS